MIEEKKRQTELELPRDCTFSPEDWRILAQYWYPVATAAEVQDQPVAVKLLDMKLVCYRSGGKVVIARDLCFHRGAPLSKGWVENGRLSARITGSAIIVRGNVLRYRHIQALKSRPN